jgi:hypothetical protein
MSIDLTYDFIAIDEFALNKPPFTLHVLITNFVTMRKIMVIYQKILVNLYIKSLILLNLTNSLNL